MKFKEKQSRLPISPSLTITTSSESNPQLQQPLTTGKRIAPHIVAAFDVNVPANKVYQHNFCGSRFASLYPPPWNALRGIPIHLPESTLPSTTTSETPKKDLPSKKSKEETRLKKEREKAHQIGTSPRPVTLETISKAELDRLKADCWLMSPPCQPYTSIGKLKLFKNCISLLSYWAKF
jgi:site-specific DNA-cytosine methylase